MKTYLREEMFEIDSSKIEKLFWLNSNKLEQSRMNPVNSNNFDRTDVKRKYISVENLLKSFEWNKSYAK